MWRFVPEGENPDSFSAIWVTTYSSLNSSKLSYCRQKGPSAIQNIALLDCGASVNVSTLQIFEQLLQLQLITPDDYTKLQVPSPVGMADGRPSYRSGYVRACFRIDHTSFRAPIMVLATSSHDVILGVPGLKTCFG